MTDERAALAVRLAREAGFTACLARTTERLELSGHPAFEDTFVDSLAFPEGGAV